MTDPDGAPTPTPAAPKVDRSTARLSLAVAAMVGILGGVGLFTFGYADGASYLVDKPEACANCHVMQGHYDSWAKSSHKNVATCNDCHLKHDFIGKWITKADNGTFHALAFTTGDYPRPIQIKERNRAVTQEACLHCHQDYVQNMLPIRAGGEMQTCAKCHGDVGHSQRRMGLTQRP